jgi:hypothetical protein
MAGDATDVGNLAVDGRTSSTVRWMPAPPAGFVVVDGWSMTPGGWTSML